MKRILLKSLSYATMHLTVAIGVAYAITGDWILALSVGLIEPAVQTCFFALHERVWEGRRQRRDSRPSGPLSPA